jgi:hypothetical protein
VLIDGDASYTSGVYIDRNGTEKDGSIYVSKI